METKKIVKKDGFLEEKVDFQRMFITHYNKNVKCGASIEEWRAVLNFDEFPCPYDPNTPGPTRFLINNKIINYIVYMRDGQPHRVDGPAVIYLDGKRKIDLAYYWEGELLDCGHEGFWKLWDHLTEEQQSSLTLHMYMPRIG